MKTTAMYLLVALLGAALAPAAGSDSTHIPQKSDSYKFPVVPGTPEWYGLRTHNERLQACQVPEAVLSNMSTYGLAQTCLKYPLLQEIFLDICPQDGVDKAISRFNGLQELFRRPDVGVTLYQIYQATEPAAIDPGWSLGERGRYSYRLASLELLLGQQESLASLGPKEQHALLAGCLEWLDAKNTRRETYGPGCKAITGLVMGRILLQIPYDSFRERVQEDSQLGGFLSRGCPSRGPQLETIVQFTERCLAGND